MFSGDHIMAGRPDRGATGRRDERLHGFTLKALEAHRADLFPGHGGAVRNAPRSCRLHHRQAREASILHRLAKGEADIPAWLRRSTGSNRGSSARPLSQCWRISRTWWRAASSRPKASLRSAAAIAWPRRLCPPLEALTPLVGFSCSLCGRASTSSMSSIRERRARHWCRGRGGRSATPSARRCGRRRWSGARAPPHHRGSPGSACAPPPRSGRRAATDPAGGRPTTLRRTGIDMRHLRLIIIAIAAS